MWLGENSGWLCLAAVAAGFFVSGCAAERNRYARTPAETLLRTERLARELSGAPQLAARDVCTPARVTSVGERMEVPNPDGKTYDVLQWFWRGYNGPTQVSIVDLATGEVKTANIPDKRQIHMCGRVLGPDGKLYLATVGRDSDTSAGMDVYIYDPARNELERKGIVMQNLKGELRPLCVSSDGMIFGAGCNFDLKKLGLYMLNPKTGAVTEYGWIGPSWAPLDVWAQYIAADDKFVYLAGGKTPWRLIAVNRETRESEVLLTTAKLAANVAVVLRQGRYGCSGYAVDVEGTDGKRIDFWLRDGKVIVKKEAKEAPPWPEPQEVKPGVAQPPLPELELEQTFGDADILWYRAPEAKAAANAPAGATLEQLGWKSVRLMRPTWPITVLGLIALPDARIYGYVGPYGGNFIYDPKTDKPEYLGKFWLSVYTMIYHDKAVYMSGYPASRLYRCDLARPWTANTYRGPGKGTVDEWNDADSNPRFLAHMRDHGAGTHKTFSSVLGADGKLYFGGQWVRDAENGGLSWWNPRESDAKKACGGTWEDISNYGIPGSDRLAAVGKYIVVSTTPERDQKLGKPTPTEGKLLLFDTNAGKFMGGMAPLAGSPDPGPIAAIGGNLVMGVAVDPGDVNKSVLYVADVAAGKVLLSQPVPGRQSGDFLFGPDGHVWTFVGDALVRIDTRTAEVEPVGKIEGKGRFAFSGRDLYMAGREQLRRVKDVVPAAAK